MSGSWALPEELRQLAEADEGLVKEVLSVFQSDTADRVQKLRGAVEQDDRTLVKNQAHAMKGSAGQVGASVVADLCRQIELQALTADGAVLRELTARLETAFAEVCRQMDA